MTSGHAVAVRRQLDAMTLCTIDLDTRPAAVYATFPQSGADLSMREHNGLVTLWDGTGRIVAADPTGSGHLASFVTRA